MANSASLVVNIKANVTAFNKSMKKVKKRVTEFGDKAKSKLAPTFKAISRQGKAAFMVIQKSIMTVIKSTAALVTVLGTLTAIRLASVTQSFKELAQWSDTLGTSVPELQKWAAAAKTVGIEQEKLTDIFKDVNDKVGDFLMNNAGPMVEIFEKLGISIDQVRNKKPEQILELLSRESAKLGKQQRVFIFEAIASDSAKLLPLLDKNSKALRMLFKEYEELGLVVTSTESKALQSFGSSLDFISRLFTGLSEKVAASVAPAFAAFAESIRNSIKTYGGLGEVARSVGAFLIESTATVIEGFASVPMVIGGIITALNKLAATGKSVFGFLVESAGRYAEALADVNIESTKALLERARARGQTEEVTELEEVLKAAEARRALSIEQQKSGQDLGKDLATFEITVDDSVYKTVAEMRAAAEAMRKGGQQLKDEVNKTTTADLKRRADEITSITTNAVASVEPILSRAKDLQAQVDIIQSNLRTESAMQAGGSGVGGGFGGISMTAPQQPVKVENKVVIEGDLRGIISAVVQSEDFQSFRDSITEFGVEDAARSVTQ